MISQLDLEGVGRHGRPGGYGLKHNSTYIKQEQFGGPKFIVLDEDIYVNQENETISLDLTSVFTPGRNHVFAQLNILPIYFLADDGTKETGVINSNHVDLGKALPDITFGQLFTAVSNIFNLDITVINQTVFLNYINKQVLKNNLVDLSKYEKKNVNVSFNHNNKYLLKYEENEDEKVLDRIIIDAKEIKVVKPSEMLPEIENTISIDAFPLLYEENTVITKDLGSDKINLLIYNGLLEGSNYVQVPTSLLIPSIHNQYYKEWLNNRAVAKSFDIDFSAMTEDAVSIKVKDRIFMHNNFHIIKSISKQQVSRDIVEIEMKTETLKIS
ncbi:hypothetical protein [Myroides odoratus]|uniref:hypothetical protein n=1 Tax=Myroides odoratus TaxID=256 RepID=UPI0039B069E0